ncbi:S-adenosyl-L-methionine-dependent methyltransferase [Mycena indigotica]|uniref:S-adenosyl-L-methionine-dependent methyltransferase n=1 Tax=Mycena indigotica TaxID=2126181 RepID=A0A8H6WHW0_9AGAR|nr:S-adenosyl-L-methionine-dependent methyltransferase [Mycena indigotica]KAF7315498.1 S-adenosyl-L-methionine-dependent methyltransferase [Mycena indigotica]
MTFSQLVARLGRRQAALELKWMKAASQKQPLEEMLARRVVGEPLQYILETQPFGSLILKTKPPTLIPRPETEHWTIRLAELLQKTNSAKKVLDLGTGSGCIPLLLCALLPAGTITAFGIDHSPTAVQLAQENAAVTESERRGNTFQAIQASFLDPLFPQPHLGLAPPFDVVTSNPPYISWQEYLSLPNSVRDYEDPTALFGGPEGLDFYHAIARLISTDGFLSPSAVVAVEVGHDQAEQVQTIFRTVSHLNSTIWTDPWNKNRTVVLEH